MNEASPLTLESFQPFEPQHLSCPHAAWAMLRKEAPIYRLDMPTMPVPVFMVTRRREIDYIVAHPKLFSNQPAPSVWRWGEFHEPEIAEAFAKCGRKIVYTLQTTDPPDSVMYRRLVDEVLSRRGVKDMAGEIESVVRRLIEAIPSDQPVNFVEAFSIPLPLLVICLILGVPYDDAAMLRHYTDEFGLLLDPVTPTARAAKAAETIADGYRYLEQRLLEYRERPANTLLSAFANARFQDGRPATIEEALSMAHTATIAGNETTRNALSSAMYTLARRPDLWRRLKAEPERAADFVEELLRFAAPANTTPRTALEDVEIDGVAIPKGSCLFIMWGSGSLDEAIFPNAEEFDLDRKNKRHHSTFGVGIHFCAGLHLARSELTIAVTQWLKEFESVEFAVPESEIHYEPIFAFHALGALPLRFTRAPR